MDNFGFGFSINQSLIINHKLFLMFGAEYNNTRQFKYIMTEGKYSHTTDINYSFNSLSLPVSIRFQPGNKYEYFVELGFFFDPLTKIREEGMLHTYLPNQNGQYDYKVDDIVDSYFAKNSNYGPLGAIGIKFPNNFYNLIIKIDYKYGIPELFNGLHPIYNRYIRISLGIRFNNFK
ncbi:MAG: hypothetical protein U9R19_14340 [Bacteroidota bacterium]|nr:hypothetical protein [Bacteroidota bacterium]